MAKKGIEISSNIITIRSIEDCIRATKKYTEGIKTMRKTHPIQGEDFPSSVFCKYYEVYPDYKVELDMDVSELFDWLWPDTLCIGIMFHYDYREDKASIVIRDGVEAVKKLNSTIPGFGNILWSINGIKEQSKV